MATLAIDPALSCGWAVRLDDGSVQSGTWEFGKDKRFGRRMLALWSELSGIAQNVDEITRVVYERVEGHPRPGRILANGKRQPGGTNLYAAHLYGAITGIIEMWAVHHGAAVSTVHTGTLKKWATGKGNARKLDMVRSARLRFPGHEIGDDNEADALCLLAYSEHDFRPDKEDA